MSFPLSSLLKPAEQDQQIRTLAREKRDLQAQLRESKAQSESLRQELNQVRAALKETEQRNEELEGVAKVHELQMQQMQLIVEAEQARRKAEIAHYVRKEQESMHGMQPMVEDD